MYYHKPGLFLGFWFLPRADLHPLSSYLSEYLEIQTYTIMPRYPSFMKDNFARYRIFTMPFHWFWPPWFLM
jgi:hypothetical protein